MSLSESAWKILASSGMQRDPTRTCSEEELRRRLEELGLPVYDSALAFEREFGGMAWDFMRFGTFAAVMGRTAANVWKIAGSPKLLPEVYGGEILLPVALGGDGLAYYWINHAGWILAEPFSFGVFPVAESAACFFEREALRKKIDDRPTAILRWRAIPTGTPEDFGRFRVDEPEEPDDDEDHDLVPFEYPDDPERHFDDRLAEALGLPLYQPASDRWAHLFYDGVNLLYPYYSWGPDQRFIRGGTMDDMVRMLQAAAQVRPTVGVWWRGPLGDPPQPGEPVALELASIDERSRWTGHLLVLGSPGCYRVYERRFEEPRWIVRLWEKRREEWLAERT